MITMLHHLSSTRNKTALKVIAVFLHLDSSHVQVSGMRLAVCYLLQIKNQMEKIYSCRQFFSSKYINVKARGASVTKEGKKTLKLKASL